MSLKDIYNSLVDADQEKVAQVHGADEQGDLSEADPALIKTAQDYDHIGRVLAHNAFADMVKEAMDEAMPEASEDEKEGELAKILAKARGEGSKDEDKDDEDEDDEKKEGEGEKKENPFAEKKASIKAAILQRMAEDPEYVSHLVAKYQQR